MVKMHTVRILLLLTLFSPSLLGQTRKTANDASQRPKLVVGLVVDQMRWDYLYRYYDRYAPGGGFKRLLNKGFSCENTLINYVPTITACGHTSLYTGSVPAIHGIVGNEWHDNSTGRDMYCTDDSTVQGVGTTEAAGRMSPENMRVTTICDELRLATDFRSKVIGVAIKDRGGILPAGHAANAAYWYEAASGNWISSTYYMKNLPQWVTEFNAKKYPDQYLRKGWQTLYPIDTYTQSTADTRPYESKPFGNELTRFPYDLSSFAGKKYGALSSTPFGNTLTREMAMAAIKGEGLGKDSITDLLAISFSSTDYVGHAFGPNSIEAEDTYLRLDQDLGTLLDYLDAQVGKGQYLVFLSADHGAAHSGGFSVENKLPGGGFAYGAMQKSLDSALRVRFGNHQLIAASENYQLYFNHRLMDSLKIDQATLAEAVSKFLYRYPEVDRVLATGNVRQVTIPDKLSQMVVNGYHPARSGDIQIMLKSGYMSGSGIGTTHGSWNPYDAHIPLLWYGWKIKPGKMNRETHIIDMAPTLAAMLHIQMPSGNIGDVITEITATN